MMKRAITVLIVLAFVVGVAGGPVLAEDNMQTYRANEKEPFIGAGAAFVLPSLGHLYAEDWNRSLPYLGGMAAGIGVSTVGSIAVGAVSPTGGALVGLAGSIITGGAYILHIVDAYRAVEDYNEQLREELGIEEEFQVRVVPGEEDVKMAFQYSF